MPKCVNIDGAGYVVESLEVYPQCSELALLEPSNLQALTFWSDLSLMLEPGQPGAWAFYAQVLLVFIAAWGAKQVARLILNR